MGSSELLRMWRTDLQNLNLKLKGSIINLCFLIKRLKWNVLMWQLLCTSAILTSKANASCWVRNGCFRLIVIRPCSFNISASLFTGSCLILFVIALKKHLPSLLTAENNSALISNWFSVLHVTILQDLVVSVYLTLRSLTLYIYGAPTLDVSRSHTTTQHSR